MQFVDSFLIYILRIIQVKSTIGYSKYRKITYIKKRKQSYTGMFYNGYMVHTISLHFQRPVD